VEERFNAAGPSSAVSIAKVHAQLHRLILGRYQAYLRRDADSATLIDTGEAGAWPMIADAMGQIDLPPTDLERVVLAHFHNDHSRSAAGVRDRSGAAVAAHAADAAIIRGEREGPAPNFTDFERDLHARVAGGLLPAPPVHVDQNQAVRSSKRLAELDVDVVCFGHGEPVLGHARTRLRHVAVLTAD
jgi:glyoxylase-like metal-dependent hydrolase (beta-lactamase superfamily II)